MPPRCYTGIAAEPDAGVPIKRDVNIWLVRTMLSAGRP